MRRKPTIGITCNYSEREKPTRQRSHANIGYSEGIYAAGGIPLLIPIPLTPTPAHLEEILQALDGIVFTGGDDLHPSHYGQPPHPANRLMNKQRDAVELPLVRKADELKLPIFAICLGFQVLHVARGGRLVQHLYDLDRDAEITHNRPHDENAYHSVRIDGSSQLARIVGATSIEVNSRHHQVVDASVDVPGLVRTAWATDGLLEAVESDDDSRFVLGVQWHPEDMLERPEHLALFEAFVDAAKANRRATIVA